VPEVDLDIHLRVGLAERGEGLLHLLGRWRLPVLQSGIEGSA
jgi:hypothetical protein